ncbi:carboxyesterase [Aspergillus heteromorphus CBS 117.55]|uniref:Carboxylic ester hydrolase n=1 Tax=Aspergillus heteromorphus CBS 117.55 TaxID=1448321 RepID=A0A317X3C5_9EURO|nr:carboxyesterase [Aspergillus heteromorphus CBS 117.55]PWY92122.1 carboxyesterase [Aspergillus heteromorphus CBS 117.55]
MFKKAGALLALVVAGTAAPTTTTSSPTASVQNGTYVGVRNANYQQDFFLGMPYAQQPVGDLRFTVAQPLNESWDGERDAKEYSHICVGYGTDSIWYPQAEACLTLNVIRDSSVTESSELPVGVWIHGGGFFEGSSADQRYNMSAIVANSYKIGKPFIAVSLNYRLSAWGFLSSSQVWGTGNTNLGIRDQRLALQWIKENIGAFGGDPDKITIWGESAGAMSVGYHLAAYGGRDDGLFRAAIMESGGTIPASPGNYTGYQTLYDDLAAKVNCSGVADSLQCLREVPFQELNAVLNGTDGESDYNFGPIVDGDLIRDWGSLQLDKQKFVKVPIISGTNTDEGTAFGPTGINTTEEFYAYLTDGESGFQLPSSIANEILQLYPDDPALGIPEFLGSARVPSKGYQWRRTCAYAGDYVMHANRRRQCEAWTETSTTAYCYRFNMRGADVPILSGATHFEEVSFVFNNIAGLGYHYGKPFAGMPESYVQLSNLMTSMWASFIHDLDPNSGIKNSSVRWQPYGKDEPVDLVFDANVTSYMEPDTWRKEGIDYINSVASAYWR